MNQRFGCKQTWTLGLILALGTSLVDASAAVNSSPDWAVTLQASLEQMADKLNATLKPFPIPDHTFRVEDYGVKPDGTTLNTIALQKAIDACSAAGGGIVLFSQGSCVTGTIQMKDGVTLQVDKGAAILGSVNLADYLREVPAISVDDKPEGVCSLIFALNCERIGIRGEGVINGRGERKNFPAKNGANGKGDMRPDLVRFTSCRKVVIDGIHFKNAADWMERYLGCQDVIIQGINVENQCNGNNDGCDICGCQNVIMRHCFINSFDDAIVLKGLDKRPTLNVLVEDCTAYSECNALKFGTESLGDCRNVLVRNVKLGGTPDDLPCLQQHRRAQSGITWASVDGSTVQNLLVTHVQMERVDSPIFLRLGNCTRWGRVGAEPGELSHLIFDDISGDNNGALGSMIAGIPGYKIHDIVIRNLNLSIAGGGKVKHGSIPENITDYPTCVMFDKRCPAYGFWIRHAEGITLQNIKLNLAKPDDRQEFMTDIDTAGVQHDSTISTTLRR